MKNWLKQNRFKISFVFLSASFFFIGTLSVKAVEGTCSWHGGVNCDAMADWDGSAVCKDGWRDSSEVYSSMQECKINRHYCTQTEANQIDSRYGTAEKLKTAEDLVSQLEELNYQIKALQIEALQIPNRIQEEYVGRGATSSGIAPIISAELSKNQNQQIIVNTQIITTKSALNTTLGNYYSSRNQADKECYALGDEVYYKSQADYFKQLQSLQIQTQNTPQYTCPANLIVSGDKCVCADGYVYSGNSCITYTQNCQAQFGSNSTSDGYKDRCYCSSGYVFNSTQTSCNKIETQTIQTPTTQTPPQQISPPKPTNPVTQNQSSQPKIKPFPISAEKTSITATTSKTDNLFTSSVKSEEVKQKTNPSKVKIFSKVKNFFSKLKFW